MKYAYILISSIYCATLGVNANSAEITNSKKNYLKITEQFNPSTTKLPANFQGHSFDELHQKLSQEIVKINNKSQYETYTQFETRLNNDFESIKSKIFSNATNQITLAFVINPHNRLSLNTRENPHFNYDPEKSKFNFTIDDDYRIDGEKTSSTFIPEYPSTRHSIFHVNYSERKIGSAAVKNIFGQKFLIEHREVRSDGIAAEACKIINGERSFEDPITGHLLTNLEVKLSLESPATEAERINNDIRLLAVINDIANPLTIKNAKSSHYSSDNYYTTYRTRIIFARMHSVWFFNVRTGEVLKKFPACSLPFKSKQNENTPTEFFF